MLGDGADVHLQRLGLLIDIPALPGEGGDRLGVLRGEHAHGDPGEMPGSLERQGRAQIGATCRSSSPESRNSSLAGFVGAPPAASARFLCRSAALGDHAER